MGHDSCGAVAATASGGELEGHLPAIAAAIRPAVEKVNGQQGDVVNNAARANAVMVAEQLKASKPVLSELVRSGKLTIVAAFYDIGSGKVEFI
jgi:carbonic anhydrase